MPHIALQSGVTGIRGPIVFRPAMAGPLRQLAGILLHAQHTLSQGEREPISTYVSSLNGCNYRCTVHGYTAGSRLGGEVVTCPIADPERAPISEKLRVLLLIAARVQGSGRCVAAGDVERARRLEATDLEIHAMVLVAAAFCMYNRYVDGLAAWDPGDEQIYRDVANRVVKVGYTRPGWEKPFAEAKP
jgi:alkylhydroperoxidase family enzyme